jgi:hypothetical protein
VGIPHTAVPATYIDESLCSIMNHHKIKRQFNTASVSCVPEVHPNHLCFGSGSWPCWYLQHLRWLDGCVQTAHSVTPITLLCKVLHSRGTWWLKDLVRRLDLLLHIWQVTFVLKHTK